MAGRLVPGGKLGGAVVGMVVLAATTTSDAVPLNGRAPEAVASAEMWTSPPTVAVDLTGTAAWSSAAWPTGSVPTAQVAALGAGQTVNVGPSTRRAGPLLALTETPRLVAFVDQTQITNPALCPALTSLAPESGWIRTHSCGVTGLGLGLCEGLGVGLCEGAGELGVGLGVPVLV
jgi:hypothetical protein